VEKLKPKPEITRFKGLGELPDEFKNFIEETIRLDPIMLDKKYSLSSNYCLLYGKKIIQIDKNSIIKNLKVELDTIEEA
jgi:topoisomerase-4 subunit B